MECLSFTATTTAATMTTTFLFNRPIFSGDCRLEQILQGSLRSIFTVACLFDRVDVSADDQLTDVSN